MKGSEMSNVFPMYVSMVNYQINFLIYSNTQCLIIYWSIKEYLCKGFFTKYKNSFFMISGEQSIN